MSTTSKLVIIMSTFNEEDNLNRSVESLILQSYKSWELIIVDDGSTDDTRAIAKSYADNYENIYLLINKKNCGLAYSLNKAISESKSEYIARMDADDISLKNRLKKQIEFLDQNSEIDVLGTGARLLINNRKVDTFKPKNHISILESIEKINPFFHSSVMMRRSFIESLGGYDVKCLRAQDYDLWLRGVDKYKYYNLHEILIDYTSRNQSLKSIYFGLRVRLINSFRRGRVVQGAAKAIMVFIYGLWIKTIRSIKQYFVLKAGN
jgi:glycosyltransferase EpsE